MDMRHLNQYDAFKTVIPKDVGISIIFLGSTTDQGSPHRLFHEIMEAFWDQYRKGGPLARQKPTSAQYSVAVLGGLVSAGVCLNTAIELTARAEMERIISGIMPWHKVPEVPEDRAPGIPKIDTTGWVWPQIQP